MFPNESTAAPWGTLKTAAAPTPSASGAKPAKVVKVYGVS
jgi:hypothetical protein